MPGWAVSETKFGLKKEQKIIEPTKVNADGAFVNLVRHIDREGSKRC